MATPLKWLLRGTDDGFFGVLTPIGWDPSSVLHSFTSFPMNRQHQIAVWVGFVVGLLLFLAVEEAWAQPTRSKEPVDKPTQRFLPLPDADAPDRQQQSMMLMQLREWMNREELAKKDGANPNAMTEAQNALRSLAPLLEGLSPSDLKDLSPELFKKAMSDPQIRKQAEKFLEEYAKNRRMPRAEATDEKNGIPLPPELREWIQAAKEKEKEIANESPSKAGTQDSSSGLPAGPSRSRTQPSNPEGIPKRNALSDSPLGNDQEKFKALQDLFQKLKGANENASPAESSEDASENPFETKSPSGKGSPSLGTTEPSPSSNRTVVPNGPKGPKSKTGEEVPASSSRGVERNGMPGSRVHCRVDRTTNERGEENLFPVPRIVRVGRQAESGNKSKKSWSKGAWALPCARFWRRRLKSKCKEETVLPGSCSGAGSRNGRDRHSSKVVLSLA